MVRVPFDKMEGAGNDFVFVDHRERRIADDEKVDFVRRVCRRALGVGADGAVFIEPSPDPVHAFAWDFYNADGSRAEACGNAARCAARFARAHGVTAADAFSFLTLAGAVQAEVLPGGARVRLVDATAPRELPDLPLGERTATGWFLNTGVPHLVIPVADLAEADVAGWGRTLRWHAAFQPAGTNVNFVARTADGLAIRTFERGVEDETLACGTGATASAIASAGHFGLTSPVAVTTRGGSTLTIAWEEGADGGATDVRLTGPARTVFTGEYWWVR